MRSARAITGSVLVSAGAMALGAPPGCASVLGVDKTYTLLDAAAAGAVDAGTVLADGAVVTTGTIRCAAAAVCQAGSQECCLSSDKTLACSSTTAADPCPQGTDIGCDDPSDCPGQVCCLQLDTTSDLLGTQCKASCPGSGGWTELCAPPGSTGSACPQGATCAALAVLPDPPFSTAWFYGCK